MGIVIAVISGKGGVGKTTATANLGLGIALNGKKCVVVDFEKMLLFIKGFAIWECGILDLTIMIQRLIYSVV